MVKLALGGDTYGNLGESVTEDDADFFVQRISHIVKEYNMDGVDLTQVRDCGMYTDCGLSERQKKIIKQLRVELPHKLISYTFPWGSYMHDLNLLYGPVINATHQYLGKLLD